MNKLSKEFIYQNILFNFGSFGTIKLNPSISIYELLLLSLEEYQEDKMNGESKEKIATKIIENIFTIPRKEMLNEYFCINIDKEEKLCNLPQILENYIPELSILPTFIYDFTKVRWEIEEECFHDIASILSKFYCIQPSIFDEITNEQKSIIQNIFLYSFKEMKPPKTFMEDKTIIPITSLEKLYKIFERC
jgi:DNA mismatch repair protein MLH1